jgi:peptide/nickel transport system substrate-binding protein
MLVALACGGAGDEEAPAAVTQPPDTAAATAPDTTAETTDEKMEEAPVAVKEDEKMEEAPVAVKEDEKMEEAPVAVKEDEKMEEAPVAVKEDEKMEEVPVAAPAAKTVEEKKERELAMTGKTLEEVAGLHNYYVELPMPTSFSESPIFAEQVSKGELPPVEDRLPAEPQVINTVEGIGTYGGTWRRAFTSPRDGQNYDRISHDWMMLRDIDTVTKRPHLVDKWEVVDDKVFTYHLREGVKWSDGTPLTTEDFRFAHEEISYNDEINPGRGKRLSYTEFSPLFEVVDKYTYRYTFDEATPIWNDEMDTFWGYTLHGRVGHPAYAPAHYVKQYHMDFGDQDSILSQSEDAGFSSWGSWFNEKGDSLRNVGLPTVAPWDLTSPITEPLYEFFRNPYYYEVDAEGNQLPYFDRISMTLTEDSEVLNLRAIAGEFDFQARHVQKDKLPVFLQNQEKGGYTMDVVGATSGGWGFSFNQTWDGDDDEIAKLMRTREFRYALSHAINEAEVNEVVYLGLATNQAVVPHPAVPFYLGPEWDHKNSSYDPALANTYLDGLGYDKKDSSGMRLRLDGKGPVQIEVSFVEAYFQDWETSVEMIEGYFETIGIDIFPKPVSHEAIWGWRANNLAQMYMGGAGLINPTQGESFVSQLINEWYQSDGEKGVAPGDPVMDPDGTIKRLGELGKAYQRLSLEQRTPFYIEGWKLIVDEQYGPSGPAFPPHSYGVIAIKDNLRNFPKGVPHDTPQFPGEFHPDSWYFEGGKNDAGF